MNVGKIFYSSRFIKDLKTVPREILMLAAKQEKTFRDNPLHPSLRFHPLKGSANGLWSISVTMKYRIILQRKNNGDILFYSLGTHDVYKNL